MDKSAKATEGMEEATVGPGGEETGAERDTETEKEMTKWEKVVALERADLGEGRLAEESMCQAVVLIPKGKGGYRIIGLVDVVWKVVAVILNHRITASITYHDFLHGYRSVRGTGAVTLEAKLIQKLEAMREQVLYFIFLDLHKAYGALERDRFLEILKGYDVGPRAHHILRI